METRVIHVGSACEDDEAIVEAARLLQDNQVVAFPTETVYGLGGNALDAEAVSRIYEAKGRPAHNPVIVHIADVADAKVLVREWPDVAQRLADALWPGPLTLVLPKSDIVPDIVTAGGDTVALRIPDHPVARELIRACGFPLAAPSANRSNYISPTRAEHVMKSLGGRIPLIVDGGACKSGIESTVLSLVDGVPVLLRPGAYGVKQLSDILEMEVLDKQPMDNSAPESVLLSPGQLKTHYAPRTPLYLGTADQLNTMALKLRADQRAFAVMCLTPCAKADLSNVAAEVMPMPNFPEVYAQVLYATLHELDNGHLDAILCEMPPEEQAWASILDRLRRAGKVL